MGLWRRLLRWSGNLCRELQRLGQAVVTAGEADLSPCPERWGPLLCLSFPRGKERPLQAVLGITRLKRFLGNYGNRGHPNTRKHVVAVDLSLKPLRGSQIKSTYKTEI